MSRRNLMILGILILMGITSAVSVLVYTTVIGGSGEASAEISAPTLSLATATPNLLETQVAELAAEVERLRAENATLAALNGAAGTLVPTVENAAQSSEPTQEAAASAPVLFRIVAEESEVRFILTEELRGQPTTVVGRTDQVAGDIAVDMGAPANSRVGVIRINARTLVTDNEFRNRAIRGQILQSSRDEYEFAEFTPTAISGLPETMAVGQEISFQISGDLRVRNITQAVTFDITARLASEERLEGSASASIMRGQYNLTIPGAPGVVNISEEVQLEIDFVATRVEA